MTSLVQFVDRIDASPTVRLDLNAPTSGLMVGDDGIDLSPPPVIYAGTSTILADGEFISGSSLENRQVKLPIKVVYTATADAVGTAVQNLARELNRPTNIIKVHLHGATSPVFLRTFRAGYSLSMLRMLLVERTEMTLDIPAEPYAYGTKETLAAATINNNPANGTNGCWFDIIGVKGDAPTPLFLIVPTGVVVTGRRQSVLSVRRRGTPSATPFVLQAESLNLNTDTTLPGNDAAMSGSGSNYARTSFATISTMVTRLGSSTAHPSSASVDVRGRYRVFSRHRKSVAGDTIKVRMNVASNGLAVTGDTATLAVGKAGPIYADLGVYSLPMGPDPVTDGFSGAELAATGIQIDFQAERTAGTGNLDTDVFLFVPADDSLALIKWTATSGLTDLVIDGRRNMVYGRGASGEVRTHEISEIIGRVPSISPGVTNRVFFARDVGQTSGSADDITATTQVTPYYWPRYLNPFRPAST